MNAADLNNEPDFLQSRPIRYGSPESVARPSLGSYESTLSISYLSHAYNEQTMAWQDRSQPKDAQYHHTGGWQTSPRAQNRHIGQDAIEAERSALRESQEQPPSDEDDGDDDDDMSHSELEDIAEDGSSSQTALDARAQRRKMKRFR